MKVVAVLALLSCSLLVAYAEEKYTTKYDNVDLQEILKNKRLLKSYILCLLNKGSCSPDGAELKRVLPDALKTDCSKCSEKQKEGSITVLKHVYEEEPEDFAELEKLYDPEGIYREKYREKSNKKGIKL